MRKRRVAVVGATGIAGQQFLASLAGHPWFEVTALAASARSAGKTYGEALRDAKTGAIRWWCLDAPPAAIVRLPVVAGGGFHPPPAGLVFSPLRNGPARGVPPPRAGGR